jgi:hypothetical protein
MADLLDDHGLAQGVGEKGRRTQDRLTHALDGLAKPHGCVSPANGPVNAIV